MLVDTVDAILFEICCRMSKSNFSLQDAISAAERYALDDRKITKDQLLGCLIYNYATVPPPTTRQHIYRMACQFCPHDRAALEAKLDGASDAQLLDVLAAFEKRYSLDIGEDSRIDQMQLLLRANSTLLLENVELRDQVSRIAEGQGLAVVRHAHEEVLGKLYTCLGQLEQLNEERRSLQQRNATLESQLEKLLSLHGDAASASGDGVVAQAPSVNVEAVTWKARCEALQARLEQMNATHMKELSDVSAENRKLRHEADTAHILLSSQSSRANQLARALENERQSAKSSPAGSNSSTRSMTREMECQTLVTGHLLSASLLGPAGSCSNCDSLAKQAEELRRRLSVAVEALSR